jgi:DNA-binding MarR family transcriptional regulator
MRSVEFKFDISEKVTVKKNRGLVVGLALLGSVYHTAKKKYKVKLKGDERWFDELELRPEKEDVKTCNKRAHQPNAVKIAVKIADNIRLTTAELIEITGSPRSSVSTYVTRLRNKGYVETTPDLSDKRIKYHSLTTLGREWLDKRAYEAERRDAEPKEEDFFSFKETDDDFSEPDGDKQTQFEF